MLTKLILLGILAICLLPDAVQSQGFCGLCKPDCAVNLGEESRRLSFFNNFLYYLDTLASNITVAEANTTCTSLFSRPAWPGLPGNLASIQSTQELNFVNGLGSVVTMDSLVCKIPCSDGIMNRPRPAFPGTGTIPNIYIGSNNNVEISIDNREHSNDSEEEKDLPDNKECTDEVYNTLDEGSRSIFTGQEGRFLDLATSSTKSPSWEGPGWYRLQEPAGTKIPQTPTAEKKCGTLATGWMDGKLPKKAGQTNDVKFCFSFQNKICKWSAFGKVTNCGKYFVYKLPPIPYVKAVLRYCAE